MRVRILMALALGGTLISSAQTTNPQASARALSLQDCIDLALRRNLDLQIERLSADIARYNLNGSYGAYAPYFSFQVRHEFTSEPGNLDPKKSGSDFPYELKTDSGGPNLKGILPFGLSYDLNAISAAQDARTDFRSNPATSNNFRGGIRFTNNFLADAGLTVRQHLLKDSWIDQYRETILVRRKDLKISESALRFQIMTTVLLVDLAYYDLIAAREQVRVEEKALELKQQLVSETKRRVQVGDLPPLDSEQAETQLENTLTALSAAHELMVDRQNALKNILTDNFKDWAEADLEPLDNLQAIKEDVNRSESFLRALKNRPDLREARLAVEKSAVAVQFRINQLFPSVDFLGRYGGLGAGLASSSAISDALHLRNPDYFYGAVVSFPLSNVRERNDYRASTAAKRIAELQLKKAEQEVLLQVADFVNRVQSRFSQTGSTGKARAYAEAALGAEQKKLQNGLSTSFLVLQLQETLTAARTAEVQALADYNKAQAQLAFAEGSTLERHRVRLEVR